jgi:lipoprotein NlpD
LKGHSQQRRLPRVVFALLLTAGLGGCGTEPQRPAVSTYTVRAGDTVYSIAWRHDLDYRALARWNGLEDFRIVPGQVLRLTPQAPGVASRAATATAAPVAAVEWGWPTAGKVTGTVRQPAGGLGLTIAGTAGQVVRAAATGRVVYTGSGLRSYGQLVIIKHDGDYLSAYGYNASLRVAEGEQVVRGQPIATMGLGRDATRADAPGAQPLLYFEIRRNGRPLDPLAFLPQR